MTFEQVANTKTEEIGIEAFLQNPSFQRFAAGFEEYQEVLKHAPDKEIIKARFHSLYDVRLSHEEEDFEKKKLMEEVFSLIHGASNDCENGDFSNEKLAAQFAASSVGSLFLQDWNRHEGDFDEKSKMNFLNDLVAYQQDDENNISLHIRPTGVESKALLSEIIRGLRILRDKLQSGEIKADKIKMTSWLFDGEIGEKAKRMLGGDIIFKDVTETEDEDNSAQASQYMALQYNKRSMRKYLETGEKPVVKKATMTVGEFIKAIK